MKYDYPYDCPKCGRILMEREMKDKELETCNKCGEKVTRFFGKVNYTWKTDGFAGSGTSSSSKR